MQHDEKSMAFLLEIISFVLLSHGTSSPHTVLAISTKSPENKDLEILDFLIKIDFDITFTL